MNIIDEFPWVIADNKTYDIVSIGTFEGLSKSNKGHLMTYRTWKQIVEERGLTPNDFLYRVFKSVPEDYIPEH